MSESDTKYEKLNKYLDLAKYQLDEATVQQPVLFERVTDELSRAWLSFSDLKLEVEILEKTTEIRVRKELKEQGEKTTEKQVEALVETDKDLITRRTALHEAEFEYMRWNNLRRAFEMRADSIRNLSMFFSKSYSAYTE